MSYELGLKGKLDTAKQDLTLPKTILENISNELKAETDGEIEGMVLPCLLYTSGQSAPVCS